MRKQPSPVSAVRITQIRTIRVIVYSLVCVPSIPARTFGHHFLKRISFAMLPAAFVVGVITTLLAALTVVSMKGLGVGVILLVIALGQMLGRLLPAASAPSFAPFQYQAQVQPAQYWRR